AIITGRRVHDARRMLGFESRYLIGNHGAEGLPDWQERSDVFAASVNRWRDVLAQAPLLAAAGVTLEDKVYSLSLHYRRAPDARRARDEIDRCLADLMPAPRVINGKAVVNLLPLDAPDKGIAVRVLMEF